MQSNLWSTAVEKIERLKALDSQRCVYGAGQHQYNFSPKCTAQEIKEVEFKLGGALPLQLKDFYLNVGNGGPGPEGKIFNTHEIVKEASPNSSYGGMLCNPTKPYHMEYETIDGELELKTNWDSDEAASGIIPLNYGGCTYHNCIVVQGERENQIVTISDDVIVHEHNMDFVSWYEGWVQSHIEEFEFLENLLNTGHSIIDMEIKFKDKYKKYGAKDYLMSLIGAQKPENLFGSERSKIYHAATQNPWYEEQISLYKEQSGKALYKNTVR